MLNPFTKATLFFWLFVLACPADLFAWPTTNQWIPLLKGGTVLQDPENDANGGVNVVPDDGSNPAAYVYNDGSYMFYRLRLDGDPSGNNGVFAQFGWGFEIDTDQNPDDYEWLIMCDGISSPEVVSLRMNTDKTGLGDPSDKAEYIAAEYPMVGNHQLTLADTSINGDQDYFLDFRVPYSVFLAATGITEDTLIRYFAGSSRSTNNLTPNGADLLGGSDLYDGLGDYISPTGELPAGVTFTDGTVRYVEDLAGFGDLTMASAGDTLYLRVYDADQTLATNPGQTVVVTLTAPSGDEEVVVLTATGVAGKFTGSIPSALGGAAQRDGTLQVSPDEWVTVTYLDAIAADLSQNVTRTDTILFTVAGTDLEIAKTVDNAIPSPGDTITYTITVTNKGPNSATGIAIQDVLHADLVNRTITPSQGSYLGSIWTVGALAVGSSATLTVVADVDPATVETSIDNTASVSALDQADANAANDSATVTINIGGTDLRLEKTVDDATPTEGNSIAYRVRVINEGSNDATGVEVTDLLPAGVTWVSDNSGGSYDPASGVWTVGDLANGGGALLRIVATVDAGTANTVITNTADLTDAGEADPDTSNNSASVDIKVDFVDLELTKTVSDVTPDASDAISYTVTVNNNGPHDASGIEVTDILPTGVTLVTATPSQGSYNSGSGVWTVGNVADGGSATLTFDVTVDAGTEGQTITNAAAITAADQSDSAPGNESDDAVIKVAGTDVMVTKSVDNPTPGEGDSVVFTITVTNNGPNTATGIEITDILPTGVIYAGKNPSQGSYDNKKTQVWTVGTLAVATSATLELTAAVDSGTSGTTIVNVAFLTAADQADPDETNNVASASITVDGTDLALTKAVDNPVPNELENVVYTLTVTNNGPSDATGVVVRDLLPPEVSYLSDDSGTTATSYDAATGLWTVGNLANGTSIDLNITATVLPGNSGMVISNVAGIAAADQGDQNPANDSASADISVAGTDLAVTKTVDNPSPGEGGPVTYTVTVTNNGVNGATGIEIEDLEPAGVTFGTVTASQGSYAAGIWLLGNLSGGASATLTVAATVRPFTAGSTITNTANIAALEQLDDNPANDGASVDIVPSALPILTVVKAADRVSVNPGEDITYTVTVTNTGSTEAHNVVLTDDPSPFSAFCFDFNGDDVADDPFIFSPGTSGLTLGTPDYSEDTNPG